MNLIELVRAAVVLFAAVGVGTVAHELAHAAWLRAAGVPCRIEWLPGRDDADLLETGVSGTWAAVTPRALPAETSPWHLRIAAMMPLLLVSPAVLVLAGVVPDPFLTDDLPLQIAVIGWLACALPSPADFSLFWHAERVIAERARPGRGERR